MFDLIYSHPAGQRARAPLSAPKYPTHSRRRTWMWLGMYASFLASPAAVAAEAIPAEASLAPPFTHYQRWRDEPMLDWREANARVGEIGGWRTYARESQQHDGAAAPGKASVQASPKPSEQPSEQPGGDQPGGAPAGDHSQHGQ